MALHSLIGQVIAGYKVESEIGRGAMAVVYKARDINLHRVVALKVLAPLSTDDATFVKRFVTEARAAAQLSHSNIVTIHQAGEYHGVYFIAMEYVEGKTLAQCLTLPGRFEVGKALDITLQVGKALVEAHAKGIVHRDINPRNIMLDDTGRVRVLDFGLAKLLQGRTVLTTDGGTPGTPAYMAPEQVNGEEVDPRTDIYSLGATLYEMLTGQLPYWGDSPLAVMREIAEKPFPILSLNNLVPHPVVQLVSKMTNRNPNYRYPSAELLCADLARLLKDPLTARSQVVLDARSIEEIVSGPRVGPEELVPPVPAKARQTEPLTTSAPQPPVASPAAPAPSPTTAAPPVQREARGGRAVSRWAAAVIGGLALALIAVGIGWTLMRARAWHLQEGWVSLFNARDYEGWVSIENPGRPVLWSVEGKAMVPRIPDGDTHSHIRTIKEWKDFELELEYKARPRGDGGVYLRGRVEIQITGPENESNREQERAGRIVGDGAVVDNYKPRILASKPAGEWNRLRVRFVGDSLTAYLNDQLIHDNVRITKQCPYFGLRGGVTDPGPIMLQIIQDQGGVLYRNIRIVPIDDKQSEHRKRVSEHDSPRPGESRTFAGIEFVWIPPGSFTMGSSLHPKDVLLTYGTGIYENGAYRIPTRQEVESKYGPNHGWNTCELPRHSVTLTKGFWLGKYEVTQQQWQSVMGANPSHPNNWGDRMPVEGVSWYDCQKFVAKLNELGQGRFRLPTEAEWEYACRAGSTTEFCFGDSMSDLGAYAWYGANSSHRPHPVGERRANAWGLHDMHGNAWEWCQDGPRGYAAGATGATDPVGPATGANGVVRGACWSDGPAWCRSAFRCIVPRDFPEGVDGLRLARDE